MSRTIWKFPLEITDQQSIRMPTYFRPLCVQVQKGVPCLWCMVLEPRGDSDHTDRLVYIAGTGHKIPDTIAHWTDYVGSFQIRDGDLVFHVFVEHGPMQ